MTPQKPILLDCTLRDGGYYNSWDFSPELVKKYLGAMVSIGADVVELGFRFLDNKGFKGPAAFSNDSWLRSILPANPPQVAVMLNGADLCTDLGLESALERLFPRDAPDSPVDIVRIACHLHEYREALHATNILVARGYRVGVNLMQIAQHSDADITNFSAAAATHPIETLYFADSTGSLRPERVVEIMTLIKAQWEGAIGIHAHDNMGLALENTLTAAKHGATWLDATVTGMGRGPGNTRTEELINEVFEMRGEERSRVPLMETINQYFMPLKHEYSWGTNPYYYLAGKAGIHPTYIQSMLTDLRFDEEDIFAVIETLRQGGSSRFSSARLGSALDFYTEPAQGTWRPADHFSGRDILLLGTGPGVKKYASAVEAFIRANRPVVAALNTQADISADLIAFRFASQPVRMMADVAEHKTLTQPIIAPFSALPNHITEAFEGQNLRDFGLQVKPEQFTFGEKTCISPSFLVFAYALAALTSGGANRIFLAGFDGYEGGDPRALEMRDILSQYRAASGTPLIAITPTKHDIKMISPFGRLAA